MRPKNTALQTSLTANQTLFCTEYCLDFNATRAAIVAGYSVRSAAVIGRQNLIKPNIETTINTIKMDLAKASEMSALKIVQEHAKIAFSDAGQFRSSWITMKDFNSLTPAQKACIQEISTKVVKQNIGSNDEPVIVDVEYIKLKLYDKQKSLDKISEMLGFNAPVKYEVEGESQAGLTPFRSMTDKVGRRRKNTFEDQIGLDQLRCQPQKKSTKQVEAERQEAAKNGVPYFDDDKPKQEDSVPVLVPDLT